MNLATPWALHQFMGARGATQLVLMYQLEPGLHRLLQYL